MAGKLHDGLRSGAGEGGKGEERFFAPLRMTEWGRGGGGAGLGRDSSPRRSRLRRDADKSGCRQSRNPRQRSRDAQTAPRRSIRGAKGALRTPRGLRRPGQRFGSVH